jgi:YfiH family protein
VPDDLTLTPEVRGPLTIHPVPGVRRFGVDAFFTDRWGGVSVGPFATLNLAEHVGDQAEHVAENRRRVSDAIGVGVERLVIVRQVHGNAAVEAERVRDDTEGDALHCASTRWALAVLVADCVPILLVDEATPRIAVVHAGWRGLRRGVVGTTLAAFDHPSTVHAFVGPSISYEGYQVGPDVAEQFVDVPDALYPDVGDRLRLDLRRVAVHQLVGLGVHDANVAVSRQPTDGGELFFSDRAVRPCGRFALVARRTVAWGEMDGGSP